MTPTRDRLKVRLYRRGCRWYGDLRHLGAGREALIPEGETRATTDQLVAHDLYVRRAKELLDIGTSRRLGIARRITLRQLADLRFGYLQEEHQLRNRPRWDTLRTVAGRLTVLVDALGPSTLAARIDAAMVEDFARERERSGIARSTVLAEVSVLSQLLRWGVRRRYLTQNPVREAELPALDAAERPFLEPVQVGYLLRAAEMDRSPVAAPIVAGYALTGCRSGEIIGLDAEDIDRAGGVIHVRPNRWRLLKTPAALRDVPVWPQLKPYLPAVVAGPVFPGVGRRLGRPRQDRADLFRRVLARARELAARDGIAFPSAHITPHTLRHTYCAMRLQTLDGAQPVAVFTVMREMGWRAMAMVERIYGHLPKDRRRLDRVEYPMPAVRKAARA